MKLIWQGILEINLMVASIIFLGILPFMRGEHFNYLKSEPFYFVKMFDKFHDRFGKTISAKQGIRYEFWKISKCVKAKCMLFSVKNAKISAKDRLKFEKNPIFVDLKRTEKYLEKKRKGLYDIHGCTQRICMGCFEEKLDSQTKMYRCKGCHLTVYCSRKCQKLHWNLQHRKICKFIVWSGQTHMKRED